MNKIILISLLLITLSRTTLTAQEFVKVATLDQISKLGAETEAVELTYTRQSDEGLLKSLNKTCEHIKILSICVPNLHRGPHWESLKEFIDLKHFEIHFDASMSVGQGDRVAVRIDRVTPTRTHGTFLSNGDGYAKTYPLPVWPV